MILSSDSILIMTTFTKTGHCSKSQGFSQEQNLQRPAVDYAPLCLSVNRYTRILDQMLEGRVNTAETKTARCMNRGAGPGKVLQPPVRRSVSTFLPMLGKEKSQTQLMLLLALILNLEPML